MSATESGVQGRPGVVALLPPVRVTRRGLQVALGVVWLIDGLLQFQSYMYSSAFVHDVLDAAAAGQPSFIGAPIKTLATFYGHDQTLWNTLAAEIQCVIGLGLIFSRRTVRAALLLSFGWAFVVWWSGEGFGPLLNGAPVSPLMGAPGAALLYGLIGALLWPRRDAEMQETVDGGLLGRHGVRAVWTIMWLEAAVLWFLGVNRSSGSIHDQITSMASGSPSWLAGVQNSAASAAEGHGVLIATVLGLASVVIALGVWTRSRNVVLVFAVALSLAYWVFGQSLGGPFWAGSATDVNAAPLFVLLAFTALGLPRSGPAEADADHRTSKAVATV